CADRDEDKTEPKTCNQDGKKQRRGREIQRDGTEVKRGKAEGEEPEGKKPSRVDLIGKIADDRHGDDSSDAARRHNQARGEGGVAKQLLVEERQHGDGGVDADSKKEDQRTADQEVPVFEYLQVDQRVLAVPRPVDEQHESNDQRQHRPAEPDGPEPVDFLALVENDLERAGPDDEQAEADVVEGWSLGVPDVRRVVDEPVDHVQREQADGDVDVEGEAPGIGVGEPAAERGSENGGNHDAEGKDGHGGSALGGRKAFQQDGLRERLECTATGALDNAGEQDDRQRPGSSAGETGDRKDAHTGHQETFAAEAQ